MGKGQPYRYVPAFILLFLAREAAYGGSLLSRLEGEMPAFRVDSAVVYRSLQDLEGEGAVESYWETEGGGPPRKWYRITDHGHERLRGFRDEIEMRKRNLDFFLTTFETVVASKQRR